MGEQGQHAPDGVKVGGLGRGRLLDFNQMGGGPGGDDKVNLVVVGVAVEEEFGDVGKVGFVLEAFEQDEIFEKRAGLGAMPEGFRGGIAQEPCRQSGIAEVQFGAFDDALGHVAGIGAQQIHDAGGFEQG